MTHTQFIFVFLVVEFLYKRMYNLIPNVVCFLTVWSPLHQSLTLSDLPFHVVHLLSESEAIRGLNLPTVGVEFAGMFSAATAVILALIIKEESRRVR